MALVNSHTEMNAIKFILESKDPALFISVVPEYFNQPELKKIFLLIRKFYLDHASFMGWSLIRAAVSKACTTSDKVKFMMHMLDMIEGLDTSGMTEELMLKELQEYHKFRLVLDKTGPLISAVESKDISATLARLKSMYDSVFQEGEERAVDFDMSMMPGKVKFDFRTTGIPQIDERGGLIVAGYTIVAAPTGCGKSTLAGMICLHHYIELGLDVAYWTFEQSASEIRARIFANYADIDLGAIMSDSLSTEDTIKLRRAEAKFNCLDVPDDYPVDLALTREEFLEKVYAEFTRRPNKFWIFDNDPDWAELEVKINLMATTRNIKTAVIDYAWLVRKEKLSGGNQVADWQYQLDKSKMLKGLARKYKMSIIAPAQLQVGKKGEDPKLKFVSNAVNDTDLTLFLSRTDEDRTLGTTTVHFEKYRNFLTIPDKPFLSDFKVLNELNKARFVSLEF